jgi:predicted TPR repeat methyltransferase
VRDIHEHWNEIYATRASTELSWYERSPITSLRLIESVASGPSDAVIDVGGGTSSLVDHLLTRGFTDLTVLDIAENALNEVRHRFANEPHAVAFVHAAVQSWEPDRRYDIWHDRAVFHFLTDGADRDRYVNVASAAIRDGGFAVVGTFAEDGPTHCSGLPVSRYSPLELGTAFSPHFALVSYEREEHVSPNGQIQPFTWVVLRRT